MPFMMGEGFEEIFPDYFDLINIEEKLPSLITSRGRWWVSNPKLKQEEEIDLVAYGKGLVIFCEVKWTNKKVDIDILESLMLKSMLFPDLKNIMFYSVKVVLVKELSKKQKMMSRFN